MSKYVYRNWLIEFEYPPIPTRNLDWVATHPDYDGYGDDRIVRGKSVEAVMDEIDLWYEENGEYPFGGLFAAAIVVLAIAAIVGIGYAVTYS